MGMMSSQLRCTDKDIENVKNFVIEDKYSNVNKPGACMSGMMNIDQKIPIPFYKQGV